MAENEGKFSQKGEVENTETTEGLKKDDETPKQTRESWSKEIRKIIATLSRSISDRVSELVSQTHSTTITAASKARIIAGKSWEELHNPVILLNFLLGSGAIIGLIAGYAHYDTRYLKGKSDCAVLATASGAVAIVAADALLSTKYYKKFSK